MIRPIKVSDITSAVVQMLIDDPNIGGAGTVVERSEQWDELPGTKGWVGVYRDRVYFPPRSLGMGNGFREQRVQLVILLRESNMDSGSACEDALEELLQNVASCLLSDPSLKGMVDTLAPEFEVRYDKYDKSDGNVWIQTAALLVTGIVQVRSI